ncbi:hypothetical protein GBAR_LOCUS27128 [Geodia barretti]|uniref:Uncharacterized protein n=1 Tax=Geodia barretti TaxID=519541 RepID=A0AA35XFW8_GEOBA|nr:hypothetical protein GBAR_LOCUS27128 [Geodia barretti]
MHSAKRMIIFTINCITFRPATTIVRQSGKLYSIHVAH